MSPAQSVERCSIRRAEKEHLNAVAEVGCIVCRLYLGEDTPPEIHHLRSGVGMGQRSSHYRAIPLCPTHHRLGEKGVAYHAGRKSFEENFGTEEFLLEEVLKLV